MVAGAVIAVVLAGGGIAYANGSNQGNGNGGNGNGGNGQGNGNGGNGNGGTVSDSHPNGYHLVFSDEFSGHSLDRSKWCTRYVWDNGAALQVPDSGCLATFPDSGDTVFGVGDTLPGNGEQEVYRDTDSEGNPLHVVNDGYLSLIANNTGSGDLPYESSLIRSKQEYVPTAGHPIYITARVRQPWALGSWPAFWLMEGFGDKQHRPLWPPEIDILDSPLNYDGQFPNNFGVGGADNGGANGPITWFDTASWDGTFGFDPTWHQFHATQSLRGDVWTEFSLAWYTDHVCYSINGTQYACETYNWIHSDGTPANPATVVLNLAVGGPWAGSNGVEQWNFPYSFDVDYVRIYQK